MKATCFGHDWSSKFFCLGFERLIAFYDGSSLIRRSLTTLPHPKIAEIATLSDSNIVALLPADANEIQIWDRTARSLYFSFRPNYKVIGIRLHPDVILAICRKEIVVFHLYDTAQMRYIQTCENPHGAFDFEDNYASHNLVIPSQIVGWVSCMNWINPANPYSHFKAFDKPIKALRFSKNGKFVAAASESKEVRIFAVKTRRLLVALKLSKKDKVTDIKFDKWTMQVIVVLGRTQIKLYNLPNLDENSTKASELVLPADSFSLSKNREFWAFFGEKLFDINVVSEDCFMYKLKWDVQTKSIQRDDGTKLETK